MNTNNIFNSQLTALPEAILHDVKRIQAIPIVKTILNVVCQSTGMGFAVVARVTDRYWVACATKDEIGFGLKPGEELPLETTICQSIRQMGHPVLIDNVEKDPFYSTHQTPKLYGFQSYISVPIYLKGGELLGTLCAIHPEPRKVDCSEIREMFALFAEMIAHHVDAAGDARSGKGKQLSTLETGILWDQFMDVLGQDLRNPFSEIIASTELLRRMEIEDEVWRISEVIRTNAFRISESIENLLEVNRGRLGDDLTISCCMVEHPGLCFSKVIDDWQSVWRGRKIESNFNLSFPLFCDITRIRQLFSNLLGNALYYGSHDSTITITAENRGSQFFLSISNSSSTIPKTEKYRIFQPISGDAIKQDQQGASLGLYVAHEIAKAHQGGIYVESSDVFIRFTFFMPILRP